MKKLIKKIIPQFVINEYRNYKAKKKQRIYQKEKILYQGDKVFCPICKSNLWYLSLTDWQRKKIILDG